MNDPNGLEQTYTVAPQRPVVVKRDGLVAVTCVCILLAISGYAFDTIRQNLALAATAVRDGKTEELAYTNAEAAHVTVTNLNRFPVEACVRAIVEGPAHGRVESVAVCTGEMKPRTTQVLVAPYQIGAVEKLCAGEPDRLGYTTVDWKKCSFTIEPIR